MPDHPTISNEPDQGSPALPSHPALTRRTLLGGAGIAVGAVLVSPTSMPAIAPAASQAVSVNKVRAKGMLLKCFTGIT